MTTTYVGNVIELSGAGNSLKDAAALGNIGDVASVSFKKMVVSASAGGTVVFETDRGADTTFMTLNVGTDIPFVLEGPLHFPDGCKMGSGTATGFRVQFFL